MADIPNSYKTLWNEWEIRVFVLVSLLLQVLLIFLAPYRKKSASRRVRFLLWSFYLLADWIADFALGQLSNSQGSSTSTTSTSSKSKHSGGGGGGGTGSNSILALWAPFLILHLGGPDTITAFALEDNELWLRHLLALFYELFAAGYVVVRSLPDNPVLIPTAIMLFVGIVKYVERTCSLYKASMDGFRDSVLTKPDPGPNYAKLMGEYDSKLKANLRAEISIDHPRPIGVPIEGGEGKIETTEEDALIQAYRFFNKFRCLFVDLILSFRERSESREFFTKQTTEGGFRVVEAELNFIYDQLYTKAANIHNKKGYAIRIICSISLLAAFFVFFFTKKEDFNPTDVAITYALFGGAMGLDAVAILMLIFSDWTVVLLKRSRLQKWLARIVIKLKSRRWSGKMTQLNLICHVLRIPSRKSLRFLRRIGCVKKLSEKLCFEDMLDELLYTSREPVSRRLLDIIYEELMKKADKANNFRDIKEVCEHKGTRSLGEIGFLAERKCEEVEFDESLLLWHIATDLCYYSEEEEEDINPVEDETKSLSKKLSDYMMYLLKMQPAMMSAMAGIGLIRYRDTCAELERFMKMTDEELLPNREDILVVETCKMLLAVNTNVRPAKVKGDASKSVLFDACILAKKLKEMERVERWKVILEAWQELLTYAASHCRGIAHARQLSRGGELISLVWLSMAHLGLGEQYRIEAGYSSAKLVVEDK